MYRFIAFSIATVMLSVAASSAIAQSDVYPFSDPENKGKWKLDKNVSDEFEDGKLDLKKWMIQGKDGEYKSRWIGRAPSQFSPNNAKVEDGKLIIMSRWEPDFDFSDKIDKTDSKTPGGWKYENITTAAVISRKQFHYGYMEIKCKAADASVTSSFWATGKGQELDVFEFIGRPKQKKKKRLEKEYLATIINWSQPPGPNRRSWRAKKELDWRVAGGFHVYGCDWSEVGLKFYADGEEIESVTAKELGEKWVLKNPMWVWVDSETFPWHGNPEKGDLPADFEIEYIRIWNQK